MRTYATCVLLGLTALLTACDSVPEDAFRLSESALETRAIQTRTFEGISEAEILSAATGVLQDMGYGVDEIEAELGLLSASKTVDVSKLGRVAGLAFLDAMCILGGTSCSAVASANDEEKIALTMVATARPPGSEIYSVRITIQHLIWDKAGKIKTREAIIDEAVYQELFQKLEKSVFLEMNL